MKRLLNGVLILGVTVFMLGLSGCKTNSSLTCPDLASVKKAHVPLFAFIHHNTHQASKPNVQASNTNTAQNTPALAAAALDMPFKIRMPNTLGGQLESDKELDDMNKLLASYSDNKVALQRNDKGKLFLKAHSIKDIFALAKNANRPQGYYEKRYGNGGGDGEAGRSRSALASGILGPIGFIFAFIPILSFIAIPISLAAIITGAIGLKSHRRRLAIAGLVLGILGLIISVIMSLYYLVLFFSLLIIGL